MVSSVCFFLFIRRPLISQRTDSLLPYTTLVRSEEAGAADIEAESVMLDGAADAADIIRVLFDHRDAIPLPGQQIGGGQPGGSGTDDRDRKSTRLNSSH